MKLEKCTDVEPRGGEPLRAGGGDFFLSKSYYPPWPESTQEVMDPTQMSVVCYVEMHGTDLHFIVIVQNKKVFAVLYHIYNRLVNETSSFAIKLLVS